MDPYNEIGKNLAYELCPEIKYFVFSDMQWYCNGVRERVYGINKTYLKILADGIEAWLEKLEKTC